MAKPMGKLPLDYEDENGLIGGFSDEPMKFPPFDMGKGPMPMPGKGPMPGFMDGTGGFMDGMEDGTDGMPPIEMPGPLDML